MTPPFIRNEAHLDGCRRIRDLFRNRMPTGSGGFVALDLDLVMRWHGAEYDLDGVGALALVEVKHGDATLGNGQKQTLKLLDWLLRGTAEAHRYRGCFLIHDYGDGTFRFHGQPLRERLDEAALIRWANGLLEMPRLFGEAGEAA